MNYGQRFVTLYRRQGSRPSPRKRNAKKKNGCLRRPYKIAVKREVKSKGEKERYIHLNAEFQRIARREKKAFLCDQCKEIEENKRMGKTRDLFKKIRDTKGIFHAKMGSIKDRNGMDLTVQFSRSVVSNSLRPHESQHARPPCPSPTPGVYSNSCPLSR